MKKPVDPAATRAAVLAIKDWIAAPAEHDKPGRALLADAVRRTARTLETDAPGHRPNRDGYRSALPGVMHACGHDGHTAIGLALAERLAHPAAGWHGTIRLVFQPVLVAWALWSTGAWTAFTAWRRSRSIVHPGTD